MNFHKTVLTAGFAMFSMFFGAGNLVFPLVIGTQTLNNSSIAMLGLAITGVFVPFLGLLGVILYDGNRSNFFACIGKIPSFLLIFLMLAILGPIGVVPRCIIVAHGAFTSFYPELSLKLFSFIFCILTLILIWNHDRVIPIIGRILTPLLLLGIVLISIAGLFFTNSISNLSELSTIQSFKVGLIEGYQTMDLLAAFFFSTTTVAYIRANMRSDSSPKALLKLCLGASLIGASLIAIVYIGFVALGARHATQLLEVRPEQMFASIAGYALGPAAMPIVAVTVFLACLTTAAILAMLFAEFVQEDIFRYKLGNHTALIVTLTIAFIVSQFGFDSIRLWMGRILQVAYPGLIILTMANILNQIWKVHHFGRWSFWLTIAASTTYYVLK